MNPRCPAAFRGAWTLLEMLVVIAIITVLISVLVISLVQVRGSSKSFVCKNNLKTVAFEFIQFADDFAHPNRGDSEKFGRTGFYIEDFQERLYKISEFWDSPGFSTVKYKPGEQPLICPAGAGNLQKQSGFPCSGYAVTPATNISVGFNKRLERASVVVSGRALLKGVRLTQRLMEHPGVPLAFDVDGEAAAGRGILPYYSAPTAGDAGKYANDALWFPGLRHNREMNASFVGGHVLSSSKPDKQGGWQWKYQPRPE